MHSPGKLLATYIPMADMIAATFGKACEVVIHDLSIPQNSVVYAVNNHVTGRQVGQSFDHLIKQVLLSKTFTGDMTANYRTTTDDGREVKSSTALIRDASGEVIGAFCVNYDLSALGPMQAFMESFLSLNTAPPEPETAPVENVVEIVDDLIEKIIAQTDTASMKKKEKIRLIEFMENKGVFLIKGAIDKVADRLSISKVTVYSYLDEIKKRK
ncbi:PAS domain-containing protein [Desulfoluna sp.]|uniref:helix-turn-helix transcriptional regulator n=1 Tax=Desulfoluna sp. TaxID=2045199 RepID=UPI002614AAE7|nr:PAS domain-containing protein [Desulfoluna sp.]